MSGGAHRKLLGGDAVVDHGFGNGSWNGLEPGEHVLVVEHDGAPRVLEAVVAHTMSLDWPVGVLPDSMVHFLLTTSTEGVTWCRGWEGRAATALRTAYALWTP